MWVLVRGSASLYHILKSVIFIFSFFKKLNNIECFKIILSFHLTFFVNVLYTHNGWALLSSWCPGTSKLLVYRHSQKYGKKFFITLTPCTEILCHLSLPKLPSNPGKELDNGGLLQWMLFVQFSTLFQFARNRERIIVFISRNAG